MQEKLGKYTSVARRILLIVGSPEQLILLDDPAFLPENGLPIFDFSNLDLEPKGDSQRSSQSMLSIRHRSGSVSSSHAPSVLGLNLPSSSNGGAGTYQLPFNDPFHESSGQKNVGLGLNVFGDDEVAIYNDDEILFDFGDDGELRDIPPSEREARRAGSVHPQRRLGSDSAASGRVRKEHEDALAGRALHIIDGDGDLNMFQFQYDDDQQILPDADPFFVMTGGLGANDRPLNLQDEDRIVSEEPSSESAEAPQRRKKTKAKKKVVALDEYHEIKNGDLSVWQKEYVAHQVADTLLKVNRKAVSLAKKNAFHFVFGSGLNGVGKGIGYAKFASPLEMFSGESLLAKLTGKPTPTAAVLAKKGTKRPHTDEDEEEQLETPNKRAREDEVGRAYEDDGMMLNMDFEPDASNNNNHEQSVELGRDAPPALPDYPSSAMPWNISASLTSHQRGQSSSIQGRAGVLGSQLGSVGHRLTSASPLIGRGSALPGDLEQFPQIVDDPMVMYGRDDEDLASGSHAFGGPGGGVSSSQPGGLDEFEIFGAAAAVDTQTAGTSQWVKEALDRESNNFFEYVKNTIGEKLGDELGVEEDLLGAQDYGEKSVTFEELFVPDNNSRIVAAQAFYHVLCLATKNRVWVQQTIEEMEPYGEIRIGVM